MFGRKVVNNNNNNKHHDSDDGGFFNLNKVAGGAWYTIHLLAANGDRAGLLSVLKVYAKSFTCVRCRIHLRSYITENSLPSPTLLNDAYDLFKWTIKFHNAVSIRIMKEHKGVVRTVLSEDDSLILFNELTIEAEEDEVEYKINGTCKRCGDSS